MKIITSIICWIFGLIFTITGIIGIWTSDYLVGLLFLLMGLICLPPVGGRILSKTVRIVLFIVCVGVFTPLDKYQDVKKQTSEDIAYFKKNKSTIILNTQKAFDKKNYEAVILVADKYAPAKNKKLIALKVEAQKNLKAQKAKIQEREYYPPLEVISWRCDKEYGYIFVRGEVRNISSHSIKNVMAVGEFRTKDGTLVKSEDAIIDYNPILPGQTSPFKAGGTDNPAITGANLSFKTLFGEQIDYITAKEKKKKEREKIKEVQSLLSDLGYKVGLADGIMGEKTKQAIKEFETKQGLTATGEISNQLIIELRKAINITQTL